MDEMDAVEVVLAWQEAANRQDVEALLAVSDDEIEFVGPRGVSRGSAVLRDWLARANATMETRRIFARSGRVVLEQHGVWRSPETSEVVGETVVAGEFEVRDGRVIRYARFDDLDAALDSADLDLAHEIWPTL